MAKAPLITPVLIAGCVDPDDLALRSGPASACSRSRSPTEFGWMRSEFSLAIAIQNLAWGIGQPIFGALAERFGDRKAIIAGRAAVCGGAGAVGLCGDAGAASVAGNPGRLRHRGHRVRRDPGHRRPRRQRREPRRWRWASPRRRVGRAGVRRADGRVPAAKLSAGRRCS